MKSELSWKSFMSISVSHIVFQNRNNTHFLKSFHMGVSVSTLYPGYKLGSSNYGEKKLNSVNHRNPEESLCKLEKLLLTRINF